MKFAYIMSRPERSPLKYFHKGGWIANNFQVKNKVNLILKARQRNNHTLERTHYSNGVSPIHFKTPHLSNSTDKPFTAPHRLRTSGTNTGRQSTSLLGDNEQRTQLGLCEGKFSSFKASISHRNQLLYMKPYSRNRLTSLTIDQTKREVYRQINNPDLTLFDSTFTESTPIQYLTEYSEPFASPVERPPVRTVKAHRVSLNVLRSKLKKRGGAQQQRDKCEIGGSV